ncbi:hypothetical protein M5G20_21305 [Pseudomonas sp. TNT2022 ID1044]|uniref:hypothetical protein n=1 Tax=Pseudomonas sp. TNT2022 ID1044 TaxID=2942636 RepID=UPI00235E9BF4|nr:hypothetical protein [Pseudomonas sp. TNT2022 ID1044]MDD0998386.1 hypothetical protein [Pseudomonas sp. TNT2022 ID1044]
MDSAEVRTKIKVENTLSTRQVMQGRFSDFDVQGTSLEADGDRLLLARDYEGALDVYRSIEAPDRPLREKMSYALWALGNEGAWAILGDGLDSTTEDGLAMELRAFAMTMFQSGASDKPIGDLVECVLARKDQLPSAILLLSSAIYVSVSMRLNRAEGLPLYPDSCVKAVTALREMSKAHADCMEAFAMARQVYLNGADSRPLHDLVEQIDLKECPVLGFVFNAAVQAENMGVAREVIAELCTRFAGHPNLTATVAMAAIQARDLELLEELPAELREIAMSLPGLRVLQAMANADTDELVAAVLQLKNGDGPFLNEDMAIHERLLRITWRRWDTGTWTTPYSLLAEWAAQIVPLLPAGELRDEILADAAGMGGYDLEPLTPYYCDLFNRQPTSENFSLMYEELPLDQLEDQALTQYIFDEATSEDPYCSLLDPEFAPDLEPFFKRGIADALIARATALTGKAKDEYIRVLSLWGLIRRPESVVVFDFERRLQGSDLPEGVLGHLESIRALLGGAGGSQLVYLQSQLDRLSAEVARATPVAAAEETVAVAINEILSLKSHHLNEVGLKRVATLTKRYGAPNLLSELRALAKVSNTTLGTDVVDALANHMVRQQGTLATRRSYLAGILRKRLVNLKSAWLDQQVSKCLNRGVDIEQMIELAKGVDTWDDWSAGLETLRPY